MKNIKKVLAISGILVIVLLCIVFMLKYLGYFQKDIVKDKVTIRLQWHIQSQFAGYYVALDKGFYDEAGLQVKIEQGGYGKNALSTVKEGLEQFGTKWTADLIAAGDDYISLANIVKDNGLLLISKKTKNIKDINDFKNKKISIWMIGNEYQLFVLLDKYNISRKNVKIIPQKWDMSQFLDDETDIAAAMSYNELLGIQSKGYTPENINIFSFKKYGVGFPGHNIFTSRKYYLENPDICRRFTLASLKGWQYVIDHPEETINIVMKYDKEGILDRGIQIQQINAIIELINAEAYKLGIHMKSDYKFIEKVFKEYGIIKKDVNIVKYFTNEYFD